MDTIFMNSENSKTSMPDVLTLKLTSKLDLRLGEKVIALSNQTLVFITHGEICRVHTITINLKYQHPHGMMNSNYQMDNILY